MSEDNVVFYSLNQKFVDADDEQPEQAKQVMYYSLAIGHHVGVIDCLKTALSCPYEGYKRWVDAIPAGDGRRKLEGLIKFGEITIDRSHTQLLAKTLAPIRDSLTPEQQQWTDTLMQNLHWIEQEPAMYLMVRRRNG